MTVELIIKDIKTDVVLFQSDDNEMPLPQRGEVVIVNSGVPYIVLSVILHYVSEDLVQYHANAVKSSETNTPWGLPLPPVVEP